MDCLELLVAGDLIGFQVWFKGLLIVFAISLWLFGVGFLFGGVGGLLYDCCLVWLYWFVVFVLWAVDLHFADCLNV